MPRLTNAIARDAKPKEKTYDIADESLPGFCLRVTPTGCRAWGLRYRTSDGTPRRLSLGRVEAVGVEEARRRAKKELGRAADGEDPQQERRVDRAALTVKDLCDWYLGEYVVERQKASHSIATDRSYIRCHVPPNGALARKRVAAVTRSDVEQLKLALANKPGAFRKVLCILRIMFERAEEIGARPKGSNPCTGVKATKSRCIERFLTPAERKRLEVVFAEALAIGPKRRGHVSPGAVDALRFLALTGMRAGEVTDILRWRDIDWQHGCLRLPRSKTGAKIVLLSELALELLRERHRGQPAGQRVFVGDGGGRISIGRTWRDLRERAELDDVRLHDLRHAFASDAIMAGIPLAHVGKLLGHRQMSTTQRYAHIADHALREAANVAAGRIASASAQAPDAPNAPPRSARSGTSTATSQSRGRSSAARQQERRPRI